MTGLDLYKFVDTNSIEWTKHGKKIIMFVEFECLKEFTELLGYNILDEGGLQCYLKDDCIAIDNVRFICSFFDIDADEVFVGKERG